ncbi:MAG: septal ring lytic transglycosylase RlpA family protein [Alphaproteobacteria bacterium]|nr:septal ring lytic transglycosylase RlpA family protein [Alphaproteobacteria bacterium]
MSRTKARAFAILGLAGSIAGCATSPPPGGTGHPARYKVGIPYQIGDTWYYPQEQPDYDETGVASWYGPTFYGKPTASGEIYDGEALTAAHRTLPMPVRVRVINLENGKSLVLRVNDRGPFAQGRIIDVSKHAAEILGFYAKGTARVRVTYLGRADIPALEGPRPAIPQDSSTEIARAIPAAPVRGVQTASLASPRADVQVASLQPPPMRCSAMIQIRGERLPSG